uniref:Uncharacterized protein n=1 Tax=Glossina austeni TaxID=7395 RepID=A0A1A9UHC3_GLOAU
MLIILKKKNPVGSHGIGASGVNTLGAGSTLRGSRIKSSGPPATVTGGLHRSGVSSVAGCASTGHSAKDNRCNPIGMNIFTEHNVRMYYMSITKPPLEMLICLVVVKAFLVRTHIGQRIKFKNTNVTASKGQQRKR